MFDRRNFLKSIGLSTASLAMGGLASAATPSAKSVAAPKKSRQPNIILIMSDEHKVEACGCYGSPARQVDGRSPTPAIDALAAEGVRFDSMYCAAPLCAPSRAAYMTGMYPHTTTAIYHKMQRRGPGLSRLPGVPEDIPGMGAYFREAGYSTAAIGKMHVHGETLEDWDMGFDERELRFYTKLPGKHYEDLKNGDVNRRYREMPPYDNQTYRKIDPKRFAHAPEGLLVKQNGVNQHFLETLVEHEDEMLDHLVTDRSIDFIERKTHEGQPFLIHVGLEKPHRPWTVHQRFLDQFSPAEMPLPATVAEWKEKGQFPFCQSWTHSAVEGDEARRSMAAYYGCALSVDECVGRIVDRCRELGILDNTIIVYTSDHGESLFEHGLIEKHNMLDPAVRVPFIIRAPWALARGEICHEPANLIDLIPTFCAMADISSPVGLEGVSLTAAMAGKADPDRLVFSEFYQEGSMTRPDAFLPIRMGLNQQHKYIYTHGAADQLYLRDQDDEEHLRNRAFEPEFEAVVSKLRLCTLDGWEQDEFPQISASATVSEEGVTLEWEDAGAEATYEVYRSAVSDPRKAVRLATGLTRRHLVDPDAPRGQKAFYWVLGYFHLDRPFRDQRGKSRYGAEPITSEAFSYRLPISPRIEVTVTPSFQKVFAYQPLLGSTFDRLPWIHVGPAPRVEGGEVAIAGPLTLVSSRAVESSYTFSAEVRTDRPGYDASHTLMLLFNYHNMGRFYMVGLQKDGTLGLWKRTGEWRQEVLAVKRFADIRPNDWHRIEVAVNGGEFAIRLDGEIAITHSDPDPLPPARFGFEAPLHVRSGRLRAVTTSNERSPWSWEADSGEWLFEAGREQGSPGEWVFHS